MGNTSVRITFEEFEKKVDEYKARLESLRADGSEKVKTLNLEISRVKQNKRTSKEEKQKLLAELKKQLAEAKAKAKKDKAQIKALVKEAVAYINVNYKGFHKQKKKLAAKEKAAAKAVYFHEKNAIAAQYIRDVSALTAAEPDKAKLKQKKRLLLRERKMKDFENKKFYLERKQKAKDEVHNW